MILLQLRWEERYKYGREFMELLWKRGGVVAQGTDSAAGILSGMGMGL